ncbi:MAG: helix-turn-helix transcriptional regulator, partial [Clostridia bacterium]|nr:helix-turn-helix transcriptional regulator [Clostridia bacterium]
MNQWHRHIQTISREVDDCIREKKDERVTLVTLADKLGYSPAYVSRKFRQVSGMTLRAYLQCRRLAFALTELRDSERGILEIALDYGFSSHEAFTRAFKDSYGVTPSEYREHPAPVVLRTVISP